MKVKIEVMLRDEILDPQGNTIKKSLNNLGFKRVTSVRQGKLIEINLKSKPSIQERQTIKKMCEDVLANSLTEKYKIKFFKKVRLFLKGFSESTEKLTKNTKLLKSQAIS